MDEPRGTDEGMRTGEAPVAGDEGEARSDTLTHERKTAGMAGWAYLSFVGSKALTFVATVILARLLEPAEFGLVAFALIAMQYLEIVNRFGLDTALVSWPDPVDRVADTSFWFSILSGFGFYGIAWVSAPFVADFFGADEVTGLMRAISLVLIIESFSMVHGALLRRELRFKAKLWPDLIKGVVKGAVSIGLALSGAGVWSLVWGQVAGAFAELIVLWMLVRWRPTWRLDRGLMGSIARYGGHMISVELLAAVRANADYLFVGRILGQAALGAYTLAYRLPELIIRSLNGVVGSVAHPVMAKIQDDMAALRAYYANYVRMMAMLTVPAGVGLALVAEPFVNVFYGSNWDAAIVPMQGIGIAMAISSVGWAPGVLYKAINRPAALNAVSIFKVPVMLVTLWIATPHGIGAVAWSQVGLALAYLTIDTIGIRIITGMGFTLVGEAMTPALVGSALMALAVIPMQRVLGLPAAPMLLMTPVIGGVVYVGSLRVFAPRRLDDLLTLFRRG